MVGNADPQVLTIHPTLCLLVDTWDRSLAREEKPSTIVVVAAEKLHGSDARPGAVDDHEGVTAQGADLVPLCGGDDAGASCHVVAVSLRHVAEPESAIVVANDLELVLSVRKASEIWT